MKKYLVNWIIMFFVLSMLMCCSIYMNISIINWSLRDECIIGYKEGIKIYDIDGNELRSENILYNGDIYVHGENLGKLVDLKKNYEIVGLSEYNNGFIHREIKDNSELIGSIISGILVISQICILLGLYYLLNSLNLKILDGEKTVVSKRVLWITDFYHICFSVNLFLFIVLSGLSVLKFNNISYMIEGHTEDLSNISEEYDIGNYNVIMSDGKIVVDEFNNPIKNKSYILDDVVYEYSNESKDYTTYCYANYEKDIRVLNPYSYHNLRYCLEKGTIIYIGNIMMGIFSIFALGFIFTEYKISRNMYCRDYNTKRVIKK